MIIKSYEIEVATKKEKDIIDITSKVSAAINDSNIRNGIVTIFVPGSTGAVTTIEYEPGLIHDFPAMLEKLAPEDVVYEHDKRWYDGNGHSHVRASIIGPSLTVPFNESALTLGTWQQIVFLEMDRRGRSRRIVLQILGE